MDVDYAEPGSPSPPVARLPSNPPLGSPPPLASLELIQDRLGKLVLASAAALGSCSFDDLCVRHRGPSCLTSTVCAPHPAIPILQQLRDEGAFIHRSSPDWSLEQRDAAILRGAHQSTRTNKSFVRKEFADMVESGQWLVLPYALVRHLSGLCLSPSGLVPQRNRRDRLIVDYTYSGVNQSTIPLAPDSLQFGYAFLRILQHLYRADTRRGPIYIAKIDVADAFMRIPLFVPHIPMLAAILPVYPGETPLVAFPMILPMGWIESPQYLCSVTETIADVANNLLAQGLHSGTPHRLDALADTAPAAGPIEPEPAPDATSLPTPTVRSRGPLQAPLNCVEVYMDDFILLSQQSRDQRVSARRTLFECIDSVLRPLSPGDNPRRKEPNLTKKLAQGDAHWSCKKVVLGWLIDTQARTISLPQHRRDRLLELLAAIPRSQRRTSRQKWQSLVGEIRSMALALPGGRGLFSQLQSVITYDADPKPSDRLRLSPSVHDQVDDFRWLASTLTSRPTRWGEVVDSHPVYHGAVDASGVGMGGVWLHAEETEAPLLWRVQFSADTAARLVSADNPSGDLTNSDFEQMGTVCHQDILAQCYDVRECTVCSLTDNTAALSRETRGSTSVNEPASYLCRLSSIHQRAYRYRLWLAYIPGPANVMADCLSRRWDLDDIAILSHFATHFPQAKPWRLCPLRPNMLSAAILALSKRRCDPASLLDEIPPPTPTNTNGPPSVSNTNWTPISAANRMPSRGSRSFPPASALDSIPPAVNVFDLAQWRTPSSSYHRRSPSWVVPIPLHRRNQLHRYPNHTTIESLFQGGCSARPGKTHSHCCPTHRVHYRATIWRCYLSGLT
jgi:hypothetical protein